MGRKPKKPPGGSSPSSGQKLPSARKQPTVREIYDRVFRAAGML